MEEYDIDISVRKNFEEQLRDFAWVVSKGNDLYGPHLSGEGILFVVLPVSVKILRQEHGWMSKES